MVFKLTLLFCLSHPPNMLRTDMYTNLYPQEDGCVCSQGRWPWCFAMHMAHRLPLQQGVRTDEAALERSVVPFAFELYCLAAWMATLLLMLKYQRVNPEHKHVSECNPQDCFQYSFAIGTSILMHSTNLNVNAF